MSKIQVHTFSIREKIDEAIISRWLTYVSPGQRERLSRYRFREDFLRSLAGEAMLRMMVGERVSVMPEKLVIARPEGEKPYFPDYPEIYFNISHSGEWVVCAIGDCEVGVDIEEMKGKEINPPLVRKVLTEKEREYMEKFADKDKAVIFYRFWTMKEAYCKCVGSGLRISLDKVEVDFERQRVYLVDEGKEWGGMMRNVDFKDGYVMSVCAADACEIEQR